MNTNDRGVRDEHRVLDNNERASSPRRRRQDRIGDTRPADLPIERAVKFDLIVNLKIAKTLGIELPTSLLLRANEVIE